LLPYAGGSAMVYGKWKKYLNQLIDLRLVELTGRGKRYTSPLYNSFEESINDIYNCIKEELDQGDYAFWGHSMGNLLIFELAHKIKEQGHRDPIHLFFSGRFPPHIQRDNGRLIHCLPDEELKNEIIEIGGTPKELFENKELFDIFLPVIRADYKILEEYKYIPKLNRFNFDISVFNGMEDKEIKQSDLNQWKIYTEKRCDIFQFQGGHFFINNHADKIASIINEKLTPTIKSNI
jgi:medium-chain acyl-[acyl-carrier-protein] hydrolase